MSSYPTLYTGKSGQPSRGTLEATRGKAVVYIVPKKNRWARGETEEVGTGRPSGRVAGREKRRCSRLSKPCKCPTSGTNGGAINITLP